MAGNSTLAPWLAGTPFGGDTIDDVSYGRRKSGTRFVSLAKGRMRRVPIPILQDLLLLQKGYPEGKYSGLSTEELIRLQGPSKPAKKRAKKRA